MSGEKDVGSRRRFWKSRQRIGRRWFQMVLLRKPGLHLLEHLVESLRLTVSEHLTREQARTLTSESCREVQVMP